MNMFYSTVKVTIPDTLVLGFLLLFSQYYTILFLIWEAHEETRDVVLRKKYRRMCQFTALMIGLIPVALFSHLQNYPIIGMAWVFLYGIHMDTLDHLGKWKQVGLKVFSIFTLVYLSVVFIREH